MLTSTFAWKLKFFQWKQNLFEPDTAVDAHEADLEVAVSEVWEVEVDRDRLCLLTVRSLVRRHVRDRRWNSPEVGPLEPEISLSEKVSFIIAVLLMCDLDNGIQSKKLTLFIDIRMMH
jgi:hypothetical protein